MISTARAKSRRSWLLTIYCIVVTLLCLRYIIPSRTQTRTAKVSNVAKSGSIAPFISSSKRFPNRIWQTAKTTVAGFEDDDRERVRTWTTRNQFHRYEVLTDAGAETYVRDHFRHRPDIIDTFVQIRDPILKSDFIRYLVLLGSGGVYTDLDTACLKSIDDWVPAEYQERARLVVGVEYDALDSLEWDDWTSFLQLCQWTIMSKPGHPTMQLTVDRILKRIDRLAYVKNVTISDLRPTTREVLETTGPGIWSDTVFDGLSAAIGSSFPRKNLTRLNEPRLIGDILILPVTAFGAGQHHSGAGSSDEPGAFVEHHFHGSWKKTHAFAPQLYDDSFVDKATQTSRIGAPLSDRSKATGDIDKVDVIKTS